MSLIRPASEADVEAIVELIHQLAAYERSADQVAILEEGLRNDLFGPSPAVFAHVAEEGGQVVGMAVWFLNYSTWTGRHGIFLEDLFVRPDRRGLGLGRDLLVALARVAVERGYGRIDWSVLDWNESAIGFYRSLGAVAMDEWTGFRLSGSVLKSLGSPDDPAP